MGRKSQSKQSIKKNSEKQNSKYQIKKRKELLVLVDRLLNLTSTFQSQPSLSKYWEHHLEIDKILKQIIDIESHLHDIPQKNRQSCLNVFLQWLSENEAEYEGIEIGEFMGYDLGLKAKKDFSQGTLLLTVPRKLMMTEKEAKLSSLSSFAATDPLLQNMPNITLALYLLMEKNSLDSFWKPYIDVLPEKYSTVLYFSTEELAELKPSPVLELVLKLCRSIARQYAYFYTKFLTLNDPGLSRLHETFSFESYRWAVSTVMTRQNNLQLANLDITGFIPLWDMCNHEEGEITTEFNPVKERGECYALRDFKEGEQIFIFYGSRCNADLFLHNGFVYPNNEHDSLCIQLGVSTSDPLRETKMEVLSKLGLANVTHYNMYKNKMPISAELLAFIRIFNMNKEELEKWSSGGLPSDLVSMEPESFKEVGSDLDKRAFNYLLTRCTLIRASYKTEHIETKGELSLHRENIKMLKECEVKILDNTIAFIKGVLEKLSTDGKKDK